ncbi:GDSL-like lipase/acylhydrolase [Rhizoctonia solani AG-3 Rhs1AP]|uniref:GDSL-like lipase/acylhydrolase n=1 Tax=Rhizoctonia solani AG-3 Rhs1AP TaxID=1086054 RepID=A0A0A1UIS6_9AGAM|nr:GDSL-like lipase/acylhydrolase [Rhizoctonia solani AG-3 Rhs1AP]
MRSLGWLAVCVLLQAANVNAAIGTGPHWPGFKGLQYMFIFGDSYSTVSWAPTTAPNPTAASPIGVEWPGVTSVGSFQPNWVGYVTNGFNQSNLLAYDYAISGSNITGYTSQIQTEFLPTAGQKPSDITWTADNSIFVSWIGINDLASATVPIESTIAQVMQQQQNLYTLGARNFIFINVPPWDRAPQGTTNTGLKERILTWNAQLTASALAFSNQNTDASTLVWSSWDTLNTLLNDPARYNLTSPTTVGGDIWKDDLHPTSAVHYRFANDLAGWLVSLPVGASSSITSSPTPGGVATVTIGVGATLTVYVPPSQSTATATVLPSPKSGPSSSSCVKRWSWSWTCFGLSLGLPIYGFV